MKKILVLHLGDDEEITTVSFLNQTIEIRRLGTGGDPDRAGACIAEYDGKVDAIALEGFAAQAQIGRRVAPPYDRCGVEIRYGAHAHRRWRRRARRAGTLGGDAGRSGPAGHLRREDRPHDAGPESRRADRRTQQAQPHHPLRRSLRVLQPARFSTGGQPPDAGASGGPHARSACTMRRFVACIHSPERPTRIDPNRRFIPPIFSRATSARFDVTAPALLEHKTIVVEYATAADLEDLRERGVSIVVTLMPALDGKGELGRWSAATIEAIFAALRPDPTVPLSEDVYLDLMANLDWTPAIRYLRPEEAGINKFAFVIHPLSVKFIHKAKGLRWTKYLPDELVETIMALICRHFISRASSADNRPPRASASKVICSRSARRRAR